MKKKKQGKLFFSLALLTSLPIVVLGVVLVIVGIESVSDGMNMEIQESLSGTARETVALYALAYSDDIRMEDGHFYMGETEMTGEYTLADQIKANTGADITIFWNDTRVITTIKDEEGNRAVGTTLGNEEIVENVMQGRECYITSVPVLDKIYYGYYVPLYSGDKVCGMVFAGKANESVEGSVRTITAKIILVFLLTLLIVLGIASVYARSIVVALNKIRSYIGSLAENDYNDAKMPKSILKRNDEIGEMGRYATEVGRKVNDLIANDGLTKLYNRRAGRAALRDQMEKVDAHHHDYVTVALGDIDFFKQINDNYGHDCGDMVLVKVSQIFKDNLEKKGFPVRWGGEEFLLVINGEMQEALDILEEIRKELRQTPFTYAEEEFFVTLTFGVAQYKQRTTLDELVKEADDLLYEGKAQGRDCVVSADIYLKN